MDARLVDGEQQIYRTINAAATFLGIERRVCIAGLLCALELLRHVGFYQALLTFSVYWTLAYLATKYDARLPSILPKVIWQKYALCLELRLAGGIFVVRTYDPEKVLGKRDWRMA